MSHSSRFLEIVQGVMSEVSEISVQEVFRMLEAREEFVLIDVREDSEWGTGHLPQAVHIGKGVIERDIESNVPETATKLVLYCGGGYRSALAADSLQKMGYTQVYSLAGGFSGWLAAGLAITL